MVLALYMKQSKRLENWKMAKQYRGQTQKGVTVIEHFKA